MASKVINRFYTTIIGCFQQGAAVVLVCFSHSPQKKSWSSSWLLSPWTLQRALLRWICILIQYSASSNKQVWSLNQLQPNGKVSSAIQNKSVTEKAVRKIALLCFRFSSWLEIRSLYLDTCLQVTSFFLWVIGYWWLCRTAYGINWDQTLCLGFFLFPLVAVVEVALLNTEKEKVTAF